jgi:predicted ATPase
VILLDNFEHLMAAAPLIAQILQATVRLRFVVTSRAPLHITGEQEFELPPMQVPDPQCATAAAVAGCESVRLFTERACAAWPSFVLDEGNAASIARITRRLDGLPLAVELAAARIKLLPPASLLARLEHSLPVLVGGARDLPERQQTLRATIAWSYGLPGTGAGRLLAACSVFRGGMAEGRRMSLAEAVPYAMADEPEEAWHTGPRRTLTRRELEVAALVAQCTRSSGAMAGR